MADQRSTRINIPVLVALARGCCSANVFPTEAPYKFPDIAQTVHGRADNNTVNLPDDVQEMLHRNLRSVQERVWGSSQTPARLMAVLKHSIEYILPAAPEILAGYYETLSSPPDAYGVTNIADALAVRRTVPRKTLLILYPTEAEFAHLLQERRIDVAVSSVSWIRNAAHVLHSRRACTRRLKIHIFIDTGHARTGAAPVDAEHIFAAALHHENVFEIAGLMSHFCCNRQTQGPHARELLQQWGFPDLGRNWPNDRLHSEAARMHNLQKRRVTDIFRKLRLKLAKHVAKSGMRFVHSMSCHVATSSTVSNAEDDMYLDIVRVGGLLFHGVTAFNPWNREFVNEDLASRIGGCRGRVRIQALKTLPGQRGSEWCLSYACLAAPRGAHLPFLVNEPLRVASLSGVCHERAEPYFHVWAPSADGMILKLQTVGDLYGRLAILPSRAVLSNISEVLLHDPMKTEQDG